MVTDLEQHIPALKYAQQSPNNGQPRERCARSMEAKDEPPYHDIYAQIQP